MLDSTADHIIDAAESLLSRAASIEEVTLRRIAERAGISHTAINYHFGSRDRLFRAVMMRTYKRFNGQRRSQLHNAILSAAPAAPSLEEVLRALIEPSIRWSCDPSSDYAVFRHFAVVLETTTDAEVRHPLGLVEDQFEEFVSVLRGLAPWLSEGDIGWRVYCAMAIRTAALHQADRGRVCVRDAFDIRDPQALVDQIIAVVKPMFLPMADATPKGHNRP